MSIERSINLVRDTGLEPVRNYPLVPETNVSTIPPTTHISSEDISATSKKEIVLNYAFHCYSPSKGIKRNAISSHAQLHYITYLKKCQLKIKNIK